MASARMPASTGRKTAKQPAAGKAAASKATARKTPAKKAAAKKKAASRADVKGTAANNAAVTKAVSARPAVQGATKKTAKTAARPSSGKAAATKLRMLRDGQVHVRVVVLSIGDGKRRDSSTS